MKVSKRFQWYRGYVVVGVVQKWFFDFYYDLRQCRVGYLFHPKQGRLQLNLGFFYIAFELGER